MRPVTKRIWMTLALVVALGLGWGSVDVAGAAVRVAAGAQTGTITTPGTPPVLQYRPGVLTARIIGWTPVRHSPSESATVYTHVGPLTSWSHEQQTLLVIGTAERDGQAWLRVLLGVRPDGSRGWIPRRLVTVLSDPWWITVNKTDRTVSVFKDGIPKFKAQAVIGAAGTPTPDGIAAIWESDPQPSSHDFLGAWAMPLTVLSNVLTNFGGGPGRVAIHGRGGASLANPLGSAASHGCIRIDNSAILWIARHIPVGTPVDIIG
jgi:lipoprotein-anchoring transpeptidase ErfK/SrfK